MAAPPFKPRRLDVAVFARQHGELEGTWPLAALSRLAASAFGGGVPADAAAEVAWSASGMERPVMGGPPQVWLHLHAQARVDLECQRCLGPISTTVAFDRHFRFVADEARAAEEDVDADEDVLALTHALDLQELAEDELLLALPLVPRHERCPEPLPHAEAQAEAPPEEPEPPATHRPFAGLEALRAGKPGGGGKK